VDGDEQSQSSELESSPGGSAQVAKGSKSSLGPPDNISHSLNLTRLISRQGEGYRSYRRSGQQDDRQHRDPSDHERWDAGYSHTKAALQHAPWTGEFDPLSDVILHEQMELMPAAAE
jgi:hypothetical protein